jgi:hypothetical protein
MTNVKSYQPEKANFIYIILETFLALKIINPYARYSSTVNVKNYRSEKVNVI